MTTAVESGPEAFRRLAEAVLAAHWEPEVTVRRWWAALADAGLSQPTWPDGLGGRSATAAEARAATVALGAAGTIAAPTGGMAALLAAPTLLDHGTTEQQERYLPAIARGEESWCQLFSEPGAGSDLAGLSTTAAPDGDGRLVTGQKVWSSSADVARRGLLLARTDPDAPKHLGLTMFALDMDQPGVEARPLRQMNGEANFCEVFIDRARVHPGEVIGAVGAGWEVTRTTLRHERQGAASRLGGGLVAVMSGDKAGMLDRPVGEVVTQMAGRRPERVTGYALAAKVLIELARGRDRGAEPVLQDRLAWYYARTRINRLVTQRLAETGCGYPGGGPAAQTGVSGDLRRVGGADLLGARRRGHAGRGGRSHGRRPAPLRAREPRCPPRRRDRRDPAQRPRRASARPSPRAGGGSVLMPLRIGQRPRLLSSRGRNAPWVKGLRVSVWVLPLTHLTSTLRSRG